MQWSDSYSVGESVMDETHQEFVVLYNSLNEAFTANDKAHFLKKFDAFLAHTEAHFAQEDAWMMASGFGPSNCHQGEHQRVLGVLKALRDGYATNSPEHLELLAQLLDELPVWFSGHAGSMDTALSWHLHEGGWQVERGGGIRRASSQRELAQPNTGATSNSSGSCDTSVEAGR